MFLITGWCVAQMNKHFVSVIIPVYNDLARVKICLEALEKQTYPQNLYEVIVVDNASDEYPAIKDVVCQFNQAIAAYESRPGSYAARNKGISLAKGDIIAFTDADCIPAKNWIEKGVANLLSVPNCGLVAGKIEYFFKKPNKPTAVELYDSLIGIAPKRFIALNYGATANLFTFKSVIDKVGDFDDTLKSSGDSEWGKRVFSFGYQQIYADDTCVSHPARASYPQVCKQMRRITGGWHDMRKREGYYSGLKLLKDIVTLDLKPPVKTIFRLLVGQQIFPWAEGRAKGIMQRIEFLYVIWFVRFVVIGERIRLFFGGESKRA